MTSIAVNNIIYILMMGPLGLFLRIKEGKTSVDKIIEDY